MGEIKNISSWRLSKCEENELQARVANGEDSKTVKREIQTRKAQACEARKRSAAAIAAKGDSDTKPTAKSAKKKSGDKVDHDAMAAAGAAPATADLTNASYYAEVEADLKTIHKEFPGFDSEMPLPLTGSEMDGSKTGVQEPFNLSKGQHALHVHGVYRCSIPLHWVNQFSSPNPGIPMSRRRVLDMAEFYFPAGQPAFLTGRMVEVLVDKNALTESPQNLQMVCPEEILHSLVAACAGAIRCLGFNYLSLNTGRVANYLSLLLYFATQV